jgi:hypothetical protein
MNAHPRPDPTIDPCWAVYYIGSALTTAGRFQNPDEARRACSEVGQWFPIDYGYRSADSRTLILRDAAMGAKMLSDIEAEWSAAHGSTLAWPAHDARPYVQPVRYG